MVVHVIIFPVSSIPFNVVHIFYRHLKSVFTYLLGYGNESKASIKVEPLYQGVFVDLNQIISFSGRNRKKDDFRWVIAYFLKMIRKLFLHFVQYILAVLNTFTIHFVVANNQLLESKNIRKKSMANHVLIAPFSFKFINHSKVLILFGINFVGLVSHFIKISFVDRLSKVQQMTTNS